MSFFELSALRDNPDFSPNKSPRFHRKINTEYFKRLTLPFGCLILGMFAIPIAYVFKGLKQQYGLLISLGLFLVYYTMFSVGVSMGESGAIPPAIGLWAPNILYIFVAVIGSKYANEERTIPVIQWAMSLLHSKRAEA